jgi:hypothetical protein
MARLPLVHLQVECAEVCATVLRSVGLEDSPLVGEKPGCVEEYLWCIQPTRAGWPRDPIHHCFGSLVLVTCDTDYCGLELVVGGSHPAAQGSLGVKVGHLSDFARRQLREVGTER